MEELKLSKEKAKKLFKDAPEWFQDILKSTFGHETFSGKIIDRIKTFKDVCEELNKDPESFFSNGDTPDLVAYKKLKAIILCINEGWYPDWDDVNQKKWYPWFKLSSGFGFDDSDYGYTDAYTAVGSRLCFETKEKSDYVAQQFIDLYKDLLT